MVATLVLIQDENGNLHDPDDHLRYEVGHSHRGDEENVNFITGTGFQNQKYEIQSGNKNFYGNKEISNYNHSSEYHKFYSNNNINNTAYESSSYHNPPPQTHEGNI
ncbi:hypothetical protein F2Q69_00013045 [Brassica cretica]|uniref:Uncharacterized protein n=1 Tax=Brassica cretica TaxID=69181 RepID=A0A8S9R9G8_BRACR|nr:hypothetical protein F2Q69_00013045 [Brassica cretica]